MILTAPERHELVELAAKAVAREARVVGGGWSRRRPSKPMYRGGTFEYRGTKWAACRGEQRPGYARLMDATACFMTEMDAECSVALLDPPRKNKWSLPDDVYHRRFVCAAWTGLRMLWAPAGLRDAPLQMEEPDRPTPVGVLDLLVHSIKQRATREWFEAKNSKKAEPHIHAIMDQVLRAHGYESSNKGFASYWRNVATDGTWIQTRADGGFPCSIALEVKVSEDIDAPFGQIFDDLGLHHSVVHLRFLKNEGDRRRLYGDHALVKLRRQLEESLPVTFVTLRQCALCASPLLDSQEEVPSVACESCSAAARTASG